MDKKWNDSLNFVELGRKVDFSLDSLGAAILLKDVFSKHVAGIESNVSHFSEAGNVKSGSGDLVKSKIEELGGKLMYHYLGASFNSYIWIFDNSIVELDTNGDKYLTVAAQSTDKDFVKNLRDFVVPMFQKTVTQGHVYAITSQGGRLSLSNIGNAGINLVRYNYSPKVIEGYDYIIKDLNSSTPSGRIVVLEGEPGTGKTHIVRAMLMDVPDAMFVLVSPEMVSSLGGPELLPLLLQYRNAQTGSIVLVLEDADKCLVTRDGNNINSIQSLLNLGDGILGSLLDLRIIATTNAKKLEMEAAILRPGRLSKRLEVGPLDSKTAQNIMKNLLPNNKECIYDNKLSDTVTLAEVYAIARSHGWEPQNRKKDKMVEDPREEVTDEDEDDEYN